MHRLLFLLIALVARSTLFAQSSDILAGELNADLYHAVYDPVFRMEDTLYDETSAGYILPIDLDGDFEEDLFIFSTYYRVYYTGGPYPPFYYPVWRSGLILDSLTDAVVLGSSSSRVDTIPFGTAIGDGSIWSNASTSPLDLILAQNTNNFSFQGNWKDQNEYYVGLRIRKLSGDTLYGWLKISVENSHIVHLEEYACRSFQPRDTTLTLQTSIVEVHLPQTITIAPNPSSSIVTLQLEQPVRDAQITIHSSSGIQQTQINKANGQVFVFDGEGLAPGVYFVRLQEVSGRMTTAKLVFVDH